MKLNEILVSCMFVLSIVCFIVAGFMTNWVNWLILGNTYLILGKIGEYHLNNKVTK